MKRIALFACLLIAALHTSGQTVKVVSGKEIGKDELDKISIGQKSFIRQEVDGRSRSNFFIDRKNKVLYMGIARDEDKRYRFGVLKDYTNLGDSRMMQLEMPGMEGATYSLLKMDEIGGRRFIFYTTGKGEENALYVNQVDDNFVLLGSPIKLMERKKRFQSTMVQVSEDKKSILIFQSGVGDYDEKAVGAYRENEAVSCTMLDEQFSEVWQAEYEMPFRVMKGDIARVKIDNARNMYLLTYTGKEKDQRATLYQYYWQSKGWKKTALGRPNVKTWGCDFEVFKGTTPVVAGIYGTAKANGYFVTVVDAASKTTKDIINKPFPDEYELWDGYIWTEHYGVNSIVMTDNGNITFSVEGGAQMSSATNSAVYNFMFSSVFVKQVDPAGKDVWQRIIHKQQNVQFIPNCGSHALLPKGNDIIVLYADNADNAKRGVDEKKMKLYRREKSIVVAQKIDATGKASKELIIPVGVKDDFGIDPRVMVRLEDNVYLTEFWNTDGGARSWAYSYATVDLR